jgi:hypothetical protein
MSAAGTRASSFSSSCTSTGTLDLATSRGTATMACSSATVVGMKCTVLSLVPVSPSEPSERNTRTQVTTKERRRAGVETLQKRSMAEGRNARASTPHEQFACNHNIPSAAWPSLDPARMASEGAKVAAGPAAWALENCHKRHTNEAANTHKRTRTQSNKQSSDTCHASTEHGSHTERARTGCTHQEVKGDVGALGCSCLRLRLHLIRAQQQHVDDTVVAR